MEIWLVILLIAILTMVTALFWMRWRMRVSKGRFALTTVTTLSTILLAFLTTTSAGIPSKVLSQFFKLDLNDTTLTFITASLTVIVCFFIYRFAKTAVINWEAPQRVSEVKLAEEDSQNDIIRLAASQFKLLVQRQSDPIASEYAKSWDRRFSESPKSVETRLLLKDLFHACIRETNIPEEGWRDTGKFWVGEIYVGVGNKLEPLIVLIFEETPTLKNVSERIKQLFEKESHNSDIHLYGLYFSEEDKEEISGAHEIEGIKISFLSSREMIFNSLDLKNYARALLKTFRTTQAGGTEATLANSFVELNVHSKGENSVSKPLSEVLNTWIQESSRRHLAITGEYGQGKSTAMLQYCCDWAERFLQENRINERVPLLIELRGRNPSETDPLAFISTWCSRYALLPEQVLNLIKTGDAIVIFEGFDELKNSGRAFERHQHFNALWRLAYPKTKLIFTGRPNFFLDDQEANRTLRTSGLKGAAGEAFTEIWNLEKLNIDQIEMACRSFENRVRIGIVDSIKCHPEFMEIISRPSMLPVVATIWDEIEGFRESGSELTGALLIERYLQAIYTRKEAELERDRVQYGAPSGARYLVLPKPVRELMTICVAWRMSGLQGQNTIARVEISNMVRDIYDDLFAIAKANKIAPVITDGLMEFERRHADETLADKIEIITSEICSAGLLVPDPAGGNTNLRYPHKQFYEYLICKGFCIVRIARDNPAAKLILKSSDQKNPYERLINEVNSISYLAECIGSSISEIFYLPHKILLKIDSSIEILATLITRVIIRVLNRFRPNTVDVNEEGIANYLDRLEHTDEPRRLWYAVIFSSFVPVILLLILVLFTIDFLEFLKPGRVAEVTEESFIFATAAFSILVFTSMFAGTLTLRLGSFAFIEVYYRFLIVHWRKANQRPQSKWSYFFLSTRTLTEGRVRFPDGHREDHSKIDNFLGPAQDFGDIRK
ncbi:NACHT domain-containing protein [Nitrosomonas oligotropha]|uniref:NACHT domain-containing protein n=1 Tax=Nitrosomonas oligotropha TaxID=42354 RepID=UPI001367FAE8|nr:hypothetical protein [Nitrosomonas oligotropha]MXS82489.1 hypothetical protein [Nitrosomonas oligotropha]